MDRIGPGKDRLVSESNLLFPRKFDQSRWLFVYDVDLALRQVDWRLHGWGGNDGELIASEEGVPGLIEGWSERFYDGTSRLWTYLEVQLDPNR